MYDFKVAHPETFKQISIKDMLFVYYRCPQSVKHLSLYNHYNEIGFTLSGKKTLHHSNESYTLTSEKALFVRKSAFVQEMHHDQEWEVIAFSVQDNYLKELYVEFRNHLPIKNLLETPKKTLMGINVNEVTKTCFYSLLPYFTQKRPPIPGLIELKFKELVFNILSDPENGDILSYIQSITDQHKTPIWQVMESNFMYNMSLDEFAKIADRSIASFKREFQEYYKTSPGKWLKQKRLEHAANLLVSSSKPVSEVAYDSGFENLSHFSRVFKEKYACTPIQYRIFQSQ